MNAQKLKAQCFGAPEQTVLVTCHLNDTLIGHAFATTWDFEGGAHCLALCREESITMVCMFSGSIRRHWMDHAACRR